ncbi:Pre-rRNA-processing protein TSR2 family protein [Theileria parva strain Muguga]|uniref:Pre-rRNA-processing protein TSR2 family protein n=1 Tax=Theileria parva strain Muguga TaxID=333668 RepID=UPI001C622BE4|nr:Pre-rRNA-processing protein TSR2 family protein [Theileria parva strain Muguga]KAF5153126.1 Pre-rRNA-processing protein TSR2 family protein [Theileria parva strain Muguga]
MSDPSDVFSAACRKVFDCWTALNLAVENNWGGGDGRFKKELLLNDVIDLCLHSKTLYADGVEDLIVTKIDEYFNVTLEDDSEYEIARILVKLHYTCSKSDYSYANQLMKKLKKCSLPCIPGYDSSSDDDSPVEEDAEKLKERSKRSEQVTDEDGWTTVL